MDGSVIIEMRGHYNDGITITLQNSSSMNSSDKVDQNTLAAIWFIKVGPFQGQFDIMLEVHELVGLLQALQEVEQQVGKEVEVEFVLEWYLVVLFKLSKIGHLEIETKAWTNDVRLTSTMQADQSYLPLWIRQVKNALQYFS